MTVIFTSSEALLFTTPEQFRLAQGYEVKQWPRIWGIHKPYATPTLVCAGGTINVPNSTVLAAGSCGSGRRQASHKPAKPYRPLMEDANVLKSYRLTVNRQFRGPHPITAVPSRCLYMGVQG